MLYFARPKGDDRREAAAAPPEARSAAARLGKRCWAFAHLAVLCAFALAQPLFDLLKDNPEFFAARGSTGFDIISFSVLLVLVPPLLLLAIELLAGLAGPASAAACTSSSSRCSWP